ISQVVTVIQGIAAGFSSWAQVERWCSPADQVGIIFMVTGAVLWAFTAREVPAGIGIRYCLKWVLKHLPMLEKEKDGRRCARVRCKHKRPRAALAFAQTEFKIKKKREQGI